MLAPAMYRFQCFGTAAVFGPGSTEIHFRSRKHLALLLYLSAHSSRSIGRDELADLFWNTGEKLARHSLSQALYDLKKHLPPLRLHARAGLLRIEEGHVLFEATQFEDAVRLGDLECAAKLYRGEFAPNLAMLGSPSFERWLDGERNRFATLGQAVLRRFILESDRRGLWGEVCLAALRLVRMDPLDEAGHRALMKALWLQGDQQSALQHYADVERFLTKELIGGPSLETQELVHRIRSSRPPVDDAGSERMKVAPLVGRGNDFQVLRDALAGITKGLGRIVIVRGEAGIGKTRLVEEFIKAVAVDGVHCLESRCYPAEAEVAYGPILDAVEPLAVNIAAAGDPGQDYYHLSYLFPDLFQRMPEEEGIDPAIKRRRLFEEVTDLVRTTVRLGPLVWIVENIQWIDASSVSLLHYAVRRLHGEPLLLILTLRTGQPMHDAAHLMIGDTGLCAPVDTIELRALSREDIRDLLQSVTEGVSAIDAVSLACRYAGGNPFYAIEILRATMEAAPGGTFTGADGLINDRLRSVLSVRLRGLSSKALRVLEAVAVLDRHATAGNVASAVGLSPERAADIAEELESRHLLREADEQLTFSHDICREFVYSNLGLLQRAALHLSVAEVLAATGEANAATLARHFSRGGDQARAYEYAMQAAKALSLASAHREAASMASLAASAASTAECRLAALRLEAEAELAGGRFQKATNRIETIMSLYRDLPADVEVPLRIAMMKAHVESSDWSGAAACLGSLEARLEEVHDPQMRVEWELEARSLMLKVAVLTMNDADARNTFGALSACADGAREARNLSEQASAEALLGEVVYATFFASSREAAKKIYLLRASSGQSAAPRRQQLCLYETLVWIRLAEWDKATVAAQAGLTIARSLNDLLHVAHFTNNLSCVALEQGDWLEAERLAEESLKLYASLNIDQHSSLPPLLNGANACFYQGVASRALPLFELALGIAADNGASCHQLEIHASLGLIALHYGQPREVRQHMEAVRAGVQARTGGYDRFKVEWFEAYLARLEGVPEGTVGRALTEAAKEEKERDHVNHLKLRWLAAVFGSSSTAGREDIQELLKAAGLGWFPRFTLRWLRVADSRGWVDRTALMEGSTASVH